MSNPHSAAQWRMPVLLALIAAAFLIFSGVAIVLYEEGIYRAQQVKAFTEQAAILAANETAAVIFDEACRRTPAACCRRPADPQER